MYVAPRRCSAHARFCHQTKPYDLSQHVSLALIGKYLKSINLNALVDPAHPVRSGIANSDILKSYMGLDKNDFDAIEGQPINFGALSCTYLSYPGRS